MSRSVVCCSVLQRVAACCSVRERVVSSSAYTGVGGREISLSSVLMGMNESRANGDSPPVHAEIHDADSLLSPPPPALSSSSLGPLRAGA